MATKSFPEESKAYKKLKAASPHWIRHTSASHQNAAGMPFTMVKDNLRHKSIQTIQIYVHTEDEERFLQMQKLQLNMQPCQTQMAKKLLELNII